MAFMSSSTTPRRPDFPDGLDPRAEVPLAAMLTIIARVEVAVLRISSFGLGFQLQLWQLLCPASMSSSTTPRRPGFAARLPTSITQLGAAGPRRAAREGRHLTPLLTSWAGFIS